jgi:hypothetical protein
VDVVIRLDSTFGYDLKALSQKESAAFEAAYPGQASYTFSNFKTDVLSALTKSFGAAEVKLGNKAIKIQPNGNRRSADVVVAIEFRCYTGFYNSYLMSTPNQQYESGICFFTTTNHERIINYPKLHSNNCTNKHQATDRWFKRMARILKNARNRAVEDGLMGQGIAPSYFLEGLLYNVPNQNFGGTCASTFAKSIDWICQADRSKFMCANGQHLLLGDSVSTSWPSSSCNLFLRGIIELWKRWA